MTDELLYERLAISIAHGHSPFPHVHQAAIANVNQLYPSRSRLSSGMARCCTASTRLTC